MLAPNLLFPNHVSFLRPEEGVNLFYVTPPKGELLSYEISIFLGSISSHTSSTYIYSNIL